LNTWTKQPQKLYKYIFVNKQTNTQTKESYITISTGSWGFENCTKMCYVLHYLSALSLLQSEITVGKIGA